MTMKVFPLDSHLSAMRSLERCRPGSEGGITLINKINLGLEGGRKAHFCLGAYYTDRIAENVGNSQHLV
jgi:hypothetical protein